MQDKQNYLKGTIDRFEGKLAVIKLDEGQELHWPINNLPEGVKEGTAVRLILSTSESDEEERQEVAKALLNEILKNPSTPSTSSGQAGSGPGE